MDTSTASTLLEGLPVIVLRAYGDIALYAGTVENALALFEQHVSALPPEVVEVAESHGRADAPAYFPPQLISEALHEVLVLAAGEPSRKLRSLLHGPAPRTGEDTRPVVLVQTDWKIELAVYMVANKLTIDTLTTHCSKSLLEQSRVEHTLSFLAPFVARFPNGIKYVTYKDYLEMAEAYRVIRKGLWKVDAPVNGIVSRICRFIDDYLVDKRDIRVEVSEISMKVK